MDEMRNFLVGLSKIQDINLFYGRDEEFALAFRDKEGLLEAVENAQNSKLNEKLKIDGWETKLKNLTGPDEVPHDIENVDLNLKVNIQPIGLNDHVPRYDPTNSQHVMPPIENDIFVMLSGEYDGEETFKSGPNENNFYDDHGAPLGISNHQPFNPHVTPRVDRSHHDQDHNRNPIVNRIEEGGLSSDRFGQNPRNPNQGNPFQSRPIYGGVPGSCNVACTGLCYQTCDNTCSESCTTTCWSRCGNACTATCGNICTGCNTMCYTGCKSKCENNQGFSCLNAGAKTVHIRAHGSATGSSGEPGGPNWPRNTINADTYSCIGCAYTCQFWPNKRTECWDAGCMNTCFTSCYTSCSASCFGGCVDNPGIAPGGEHHNYKAGIGRACSGNCTLNCVGTCSGVCEGECIQTCWHACKSSCYDNCQWKCHTACGSGCAQGCSKGCTGCMSCSGGCGSQAGHPACIGCGSVGGCTSTCQHDCNTNCVGWGCRSICGIDAAGSCSSNCRLSCAGVSCTSLCSDACSGYCTTCANNCGFNCGPCTGQCSIGCGHACNITCVESCAHSCDNNCLNNCTENCGGCSNLCYSCVGMCIGACSVKCTDGCTNCAHNCSGWCDISCGRGCFTNCSDRCINTCIGSCATFLTSETSSQLNGPYRPPTAEGFEFPNPQNRWEERESFKLWRDIAPPSRPIPPDHDYDIMIDLCDEEETLNNIRIRPGHIGYVTKSSTIIGGVWTINENTGEIYLNEDSMVPILEQFYPNIDDGGSIFIIVLFDNDPNRPIDINRIGVQLPWGFEHRGPIRDMDNNIVLTIQRTEFPPFYEGMNQS